MLGGATLRDSATKSMRIFIHVPVLPAIKNLYHTCGSEDRSRGGTIGTLLRAWLRRMSRMLQTFWSGGWLVYLRSR